MNKRLTVLVLLLVVALAAFFFLRNQEEADAASAYPQRALAVEDESDISRLFIADMQGRNMELLLKDGGVWMINDSVEASPSLMRDVLRAVTKIRVDHVPPKTVVPIVLKEMKATGLMVSSFDDKNNKLKSIIIGPGTQDERNSYVVVEGYDEPFAVRVPGFSGSLRPLFDLRSINSWRSKKFLTNDPATLDQVSVAYSREPGESFLIDRQNGELNLSPISSVVVNPKGEVNPRRVESYLEGLAEVYLTKRISRNRTLDSLNQMIPFMQLKYRADRDSTTIDFHPIVSKNFDGIEDSKLPIATYYVVKNRNEAVTIQTQQVEGLLRGYSGFFQ